MGTGLVIVEMSLPKNPFVFSRDPYQAILFDGVPVWRGHAWALWDARIHGVVFTLNSAIRSNNILKRFQGHGLRPGLHSQEYLYAHQHEPGFFPANPPNKTSHCGFSDGTRYYRTAKGVWAPAGARIVDFQWGIDAVNKPGGDASALVAWFNNHGYSAVRPYPTTGERHHFMFLKNPAPNAKKRLQAAYAPPPKPKPRPAPQHISQKGLDLIKSFESFVDHPYKDAVGVWTIAWGHTGPGVQTMGKITQARGETLLRSDLTRFEKAVRDLVKVPLNQHQFDALVSFVFNVGVENLRTSTLLRKLNARDYRGAADQFLRWDHAGNKVLAGLTRRRKAERALFLS